MSFKETLTTLPQYILPHHFLSRLMSKFTHSEIKPWKNLMINQIIKFYGVNMSEAKEQDINNFTSFNHFFTRELKSDVRPFTNDEDAIACPADGAVSQAGLIEQGKIFQAKGKSFSAIDLLGGDEARAKPFENGNFTTIYLSPKNYHRLHMPVTGTLTEMIHIPGKLFSVNNATANSVNGLFARNERVACLFDTEFGPMALILVGAIFVSSIETTWHGVVTPPTISTVQNWKYTENETVIAKGKEMGRFNMGSTIIVLFAKDNVNWNADLIAGETVQLGEKIGERKK